MVLKLILCNIYPYILPNIIESLVDALINKYYQNIFYRFSLRSTAHRDALLTVIHILTISKQNDEEMEQLESFPIPSKYADFVTYRYGDLLSNVESIDFSPINIDNFENNSDMIIKSFDNVINYCLNNENQSKSSDLLTRISFLCLCLENTNPYSIQAYLFY